MDSIALLGQDANFDGIPPAPYRPAGTWRLAPSCVSRWRACTHALDMSRPLWEACHHRGAWTISQSAARCFAVYTKMHHSLGGRRRRLFLHGG